MVKTIRIFKNHEKDFNESIRTRKMGVCASFVKSQDTGRRTASSYKSLTKERKGFKRNKTQENNRFITIDLNKNCDSINNLTFDFKNIDMSNCPKIPISIFQTESYPHKSVSNKFECPFLIPFGNFRR